MKQSNILLLITLTLTALLSGPQQAAAIANGDGVCSIMEKAKFECAQFGDSVVEFRGTQTSTECPLSNGNTTSCTVYFYLYSGSASSQLNVALPINVTQILTEASEIHCSQYITDGEGDPTTGFGENIFSYGICRIANNNIFSAPSDISAPTNANFLFAVDPSQVDSKNPLNWQLKKGSSIYGGTILGPQEIKEKVQETEVTLRSLDGVYVKYTNEGGTLTITGGNTNARIVPPGGMKLCYVKENGDKNVPFTDSNFSANWTCETITYASEQCDIKTDSGDPCRWIGGTCLLF